MLDFLRKLFDTDFMPHGHCFLWRPEIVWLHVVADGLITLAYYSIPLALIQILRKRKDIPFGWMFWMFGGFIFACGTTHLLNVWTLWIPAYRFDGVFKLGTALLSVTTAVLLWPLIPKAVALPSPAQLAAANQELESFSYSVSHDLRSPLRSIDGFSQALLEDCADRLDDRGRAHLNKIRASSQRMGQLIDGLLDLSRVTHARLGHDKVDLSRLAEAIATDLRRQDAERRVEFEIAPHAVVRGDEPLLRQVLENLLRNSWKFTRERPVAHIQFGARRENGRKTFYVRDDGAGFDMAYAGKLFGAFQRLHAPTAFEGTGIGLATVARIVVRHGGRVWAEGAINQGATFYFSL